MKHNNYTVSFDIGIGSVGWAVLNQDEGKLVDFGVRIFDPATPAATPRANRSARRNLRRKNWRKKQMRNAFVDFGLISNEEMLQRGYLSYTMESETIHKPKDETVHHLRQRALSEHVTRRELLLCLYNICQTRGHFLMETIDFSKDAITEDLFIEKFYNLLDPVCDEYDHDEFTKQILKPLFKNGKIPAQEIRTIFKQGFCEEPATDSTLQEVTKLLSGQKANLTKIGEFAELEKINESIYVIDLIKKDSLNPFLEAVIELNDLIAVTQVLKTDDYMCQKNVKELDAVHKVYKLQKEDSKKYKDQKKEIQNKMNIKKPGDKLRVIRNISNKYPNGLYVKEACAILKKQQEFDTDITNEFIEVVASILSARIPYYIGPLSEVAKNTWLIKPNDDKFKYSYSYSKDLVNEFETIKAWKKAMISHCTYLPEEEALPKGSFIGETFSIINELNILSAEDKDGNDYYLTQDDKVKVFNELFLQKEKVTYKDICELLNLSYFGPHTRSRVTKFNNGYTLYHQVISIVPELKLESIDEIFLNTEKVEKLEDIILSINLFDEEQSKKDYFIKNTKLSDQVASKLSRLSSKSFYSFSRKFVLETSMDEEGLSLMEQLFADNTSDFINEQMMRISSAKDKDGNPVSFDSNKYIKKLKENNALSIDLLMDDGKPFIPVSRPVIRSLNECLKVYTELLNTYGVLKEWCWKLLEN